MRKIESDHSNMNSSEENFEMENLVKTNSPNQKVAKFII